MPDTVDVVILTRDASTLSPEVEQGIRLQTDVRCHLYRVIGRPKSEDSSRWETIARARNSAKQMGTSRWLMFLDDDVILPARCLSTMLHELMQQPLYGAIAADYLGESRRNGASHVSMGATLFRRETLNRIRFRSEAGRCECQCCCDDLRRQGIGIKYSVTARAKHHLINSTSAGRHSPGDERTPSNPNGVVLAAFRDGPVVCSTHVTSRSSEIGFSHH